MEMVRKENSIGDSGKEREQREVMIYPAMDWWNVGYVFVVHLDTTCFWRKSELQGRPIACLAPPELRLAPHTTNKQGLFSPFFSLRDTEGEHGIGKRKRKCKLLCIW